MRKKWIIAAVVIVGIGLAAAGLGAWIIFGPNTKLYQGERSVYIPRGANFDQVVDSLEASDVLGSRATFELVAKVTGWADQMKAGHYALGAGLSNYRMLDIIRKGLQEPVRLTIPPGVEPDVMAAVAGRDMEFDAAAFTAALRDTTLAGELDADTSSLFAYMLPETYFFYWLTDARSVVRNIKQQFDRFYANEIKAGADSLGLSPKEVLTLASIVEWETAVEAEKPRVAGVYLNRLRIGMPLQADPTVQYAVLEQEGQKRRLLFADYRIQHSYNTYLYAGLPPGPLTNPAPSSIRAVANAERHDFMYFVAKGDGSHAFSRTLAEHNRAAQQYYALMQQRRQQQATEGTGTPQ
jgi:UPF0755 protein